MFFFVGKFYRIIMNALFILVLCSCASVSIHKLSPSGQYAPNKAPVEIWTRPFTISPNALRVDRQGEELRTFEFDLKAGMTHELLQQISKYVAPSRVASFKGTLPRGNYWLVTGEFHRVNQGSRLLRSTVGLGAGGTKMETQIIVYNLAGKVPREFLRFQTTGGSNISQGSGGIMTLPFNGPMAFTSLVNAIDGVRSGVTFDTTRTAHEIAATLSDYLKTNKIPSERRPISPKKLGELNVPWFRFKNLQPENQKSN
jgi:hypothetical protein